MSNIVPFRPQVLPAIAPPTMSSREIAELVESRHDKVKQSIDRLVMRGTIVRPQIEDEQETAITPNGGRRVYTASVYRLDKRSSFIVVAQLSPEFTARVVDRWQELEEEKKAGALALPDFTNPAEAARAWADQVEAVQLLEREQQQNRALIAAQAPAVAAQERLSQSEGSVCLSDAGRCLGMAQAKFFRWMVDNKWIFRTKDRSNRPVPYADKRSAGLMEVVTSTQRRITGDVLVQTAYVTPKGLAKLAEIHGVPGWEL